MHQEEEAFRHSCIDKRRQSDTGVHQKEEAFRHRFIGRRRPSDIGASIRGDNQTKGYIRRRRYSDRFIRRRKHSDTGASGGGDNQTQGYIRKRGRCRLSHIPTGGKTERQTGAQTTKTKQTQMEGKQSRDCQQKTEQKTEHRKHESEPDRTRSNQITTTTGNIGENIL